MLDSYERSGSVQHVRLLAGGKACVVEIDIGHCREQGGEHEAVCLTIGPAEGAEALAILTDALELMEQHVLQIRRDSSLPHTPFGPEQPAPASVRLVCSH